MICVYIFEVIPIIVISPFCHLILVLLKVCKVNFSVLLHTYLGVNYISGS